MTPSESGWTPVPNVYDTTSVHTDDPFDVVARALANLPDSPPESRSSPSHAGSGPGVGVRRDEIGGSGYILPHIDTYAARWNAVSQSYYQRFDEALKKGHQFALAMLRDPLIYSTLRERQRPVAALSWNLEPEDPQDPRQTLAVELLTKAVEAVPRFNWLKMNLLDAIWWGRSAVQLVWTRRRIEGLGFLVPGKHFPISGDKIIWKWDGTPGILVYAEYAHNPPYPWMAKHIRMTGWYGQALFLENKPLRDRFIVHEHEPTDTDFLHEHELAGGIHGVGVRGRLAHIWEIRNEVRAWGLEALQKIGANGMLYGYYPAGNGAYRDELMDMLSNLVRDNIGAIPVSGGMEALMKDALKSIPVNATGYDIIQAIGDYYDNQIKAVLLGDDSRAADDRAKATELIEDTRSSIFRSDAKSLEETLTEQLLGPMIRLNRQTLEQATGGPIDYTIRFKLKIDRPDALENLQAAQLIVGIAQAMGVPVPLDLEDLVDRAGLKPPEGGTPQSGMLPMGPEGMPAGPEADAAPLSLFA